MSTVKSKKLQVGTDATSSNNFTIYQPAVPDGTLRIGVGNSDNPTEVLKVTSSGLDITGNITATGDGLGSAGPAFSARVNSSQSVSLGTTTTVALSVEDFDTDSCFDTSTYRFTPTTAGLYQVNFNFGAGAGIPQAMYGIIRKNGSGYALQGPYMNGSSYLDDYYGIVTALISMNGTTDYIDFGYFQAGGTGTIQQTFGSAFFVREL